MPATATDEVLADIRAYQATRRALEIQYHVEAEACAMQHDYDTHALHWHYQRWTGGSLSLNWEAADMRRKYWRALQIAQDRKRAAQMPIMEAAE